MKKYSLITSIVIGLVLAAGIVMAANYATWNPSFTPGTAGYGGYDSNNNVGITGGGPNTGVSYGGRCLAGSDLICSGTLTPKHLGFSPSSTINHTAVNLAVTSPTVSFDINSRNYVTINSNVNQTGLYPTGTSVAVGDVVIIKSGTSGSSTMRFDDNGTTLALGGNITLTAGQDDILCLICTTAQGTNSRPCMARLYSSDN